jgi:hypothetical protein
MVAGVSPLSCQMFVYFKNIIAWVLLSFLIAFIIYGQEGLTWKLLCQAVLIGSVNYLIFTKNVKNKIATFVLRKKAGSPE